MCSKIVFVIVFSIALSSASFGQSIHFEELSQMPIPVTNNAVASIMIDGKYYVYSFGGLDASKQYSGITQRSFRYDVGYDIWDEISALPDTLGKIASAASTIKDKVYVIGGYHVYANGKERSSNKVHIFDAARNRFIADGSPIPVPIDDQVQAVWRDSLIYVVTGWHDTENIASVQIYNPASNIWQAGTDLPDSENYKVFGSSGVIIGDVIYYAGGAGNRDSGNFPIKPFLRKGFIDPKNPASITWEEVHTNQANLYRTGPTIFDEDPVWIGGSGRSYNFNGIAYTGQFVEPRTMIVRYSISENKMQNLSGSIPGVMDLRGVGTIDNGRYVIAGGITHGQKVSNKTFLITIR